MLLFSVINDGYFGIIQIYMWPWGKYEHESSIYPSVTSLLFVFP